MVTCFLKYLFLLKWPPLRPAGKGQMLKFCKCCPLSFFQLGHSFKGKLVTCVFHGDENVDDGDIQAVDGIDVDATAGASHHGALCEQFPYSEEEPIASTFQRWQH